MATEKKSWVKDLLVAFAATTLSIILTFGTTAVVNRVRQKQERKLTALMVMSSIEQFARDLELIEKQYGRITYRLVEGTVRPDSHVPLALRPADAGTWSHHGHYGNHLRCAWRGLLAPRNTVLDEDLRCKLRRRRGHGPHPGV